MELKLLNPAALENGDDIVAQIDELGQREAEILAADLGCSTETRYDALWARLQYKLEEEAITANGDRWTLLLKADN